MLRMCFVAASILPIAILAQPRTDFSGTWVMDPGRSESAHSGEPFKPITSVILQSDATVKIETTRGEQKEAIVYPLERGHIAAAEPSASLQPEAYWDGEKLVTETQRPVQGYTVTVKEIRTLRPGGNEMIVETMLIVQHGYTLAGAKNYATARDIYVKR